ncbi:MAG: phenylalanine--tRNA ligase subunit beta [Spirosomataceae bacterium]
MKISYNWLKSLIHIEESPEEVGKKLTSTGLEVEGIEEYNTIEGGLKGFVVGEVLTCEPFMVKEKTLSLTTVDIGTSEPSTIVCGAANVRAGQKVIVATVGTTIDLGEGKSFTIEKRKVYGHPSEGMICAEDEIGIGHSHDGILVLDTSLPNGTPAAEYFNFETDYTIEIGLTPNRADAASHLGVARDLKAVYGRELCIPSVDSFKVESNEFPIELVVEDTAACPRFCGVTIDGVTVADSPEWLKNRLKAIGLNPINNIVDITNYICHGIGQPMHAYDWHAITGQKIVVKYQPEGSKFTTLDKIERTLKGTELMICNAEEAMGIGGIFGGTKSGIKEETKRIYLECAYFDPVSIRKSAQLHGLKTDASFRFERGTDPDMKLYALKLAAVMVQEIAGGKIASEVTDFYPTPIKPFEVTVKHKNINRLIGKNLDDRLIHKILESLDIQVRSDDGGVMQVSVPPYRVDVTREADVIEEILRIYGFDNIELSDSLSSDYLSDFPVVDIDKLKMRVIEILVGNGFNEIQTLSITKPVYNQAVQAIAKGNEVKLLNPLSEELSVMRQTLLFSGMESLAYNINRRQKDLKFFEFGRTYYKTLPSPSGEGSGVRYKESFTLALWLTGNKIGETWAGKSEPVGFYDLAMAVQRIFKALKINKFDTQEADKTIFDFGLTYVVNKKPVAHLGQVKKQHAKLTDIKQTVLYAEIDWDYLLKQYSPAIEFQEIPKFPEVRRDLSLVIDKTVSFEQIEKLAYRTERNLLTAINVFDIYEGENLGADKKSYSVSFTLLDMEKTLTDDVIDKAMQKLITAYEKELGAVIRK